MRFGFRKIGCSMTWARYKMRITKYFDGSNPMSNELSKYIEPPKIHGFTNIFFTKFLFSLFYNGSVKYILRYPRFKKRHPTISIQDWHQFHLTTNDGLLSFLLRIQGLQFKRKFYSDKKFNSHFSLGNAECMWNAFEEIQGWSIGNVYEVTAVGTNKFKDALKLWSKSGGHNVVIDGTGGIFFRILDFFWKDQIVLATG